MSQTIQLPGGFQLVLPANPQPAPGVPTIPGLDLSALLSQLASGVGAQNPQAALIFSLISIVLHIGQAIHAQWSTQPAGANPSLDVVWQKFWAAATKAFPLPQPPQPSPPAAG